jgi:hypothetical protein
MEGCYFDTFLTVLTCLAAVHVLNGTMTTIFTLFNEADKKSAMEERMDLLEMEIMRILSGEYRADVPPENIMLSSSVRPTKIGIGSEDTENYADDEGGTEESETKED